jgi:NhaA family Na+:H+ antiporter
MACTLLALGIANSPFGEAYEHFWHTYVGFTFGEISLKNSLLHWVNDGLMVVFFFLVGLEIKRELLVGELASVRKAALPFMAALGGMIVPAGIYAALNAGTPAISGWGVPMATDIAFALGVLALLGRGVPTGLFVFLAALAIVDDLGAVLVIAVFYTEQIHWIALGMGGAFFAGMILLNVAGVRSPIPYALLGVATWLAFLQSGVHATIAGVLAAMAIPVRTVLDPDHFLESSREILDHFESASENAKEPVIVNEQRSASVVALEDACERVQTPLQRLEHGLLPWVTFLILPIFALGNAGVPLGGDVLSALASPLSLGIILGLVLGKQVGITLFSWIAVKVGLAALPEGVTWRHIYGTSWLAGIGFTMSLFIAMLAFGEGQALTDAKTAILVASLIAGVIGYLLLRSIGAKASGPEPGRVH